MKKRSKEYAADMYRPAHVGWYEARTLLYGENLVHSGAAYGSSGLVGDAGLGKPWVKRYWDGRSWKFTDRYGHFHPADMVSCSFRGLARPAK